jgi:hypothetical protein
MGQPVAVTEKLSPRGLARFELNRALTGMGHEYFEAAAEASGPRPAAELARRLFATGQVDTVHVYANIVSVQLCRGGQPEMLTDVIRGLYRYWQPGMKPPAFEDLMAPDEEAAAAPAAGGGGDGADPATAAAAARVPAHLLERSRAGRARWNAKAGG